MNGLRQPGPHETTRQLRERLALAEACEPIQQAHLDAKAAYAAALQDGDQAAAAEAKAVKEAAALRLNETRKWLRAEARIVRVAAELADPGRWPADVRAQLEREHASLEQLLAPYREAFGASSHAGAAGATEAVMPALKVRAKGGN